MSSFFCSLINEEKLSVYFEFGGVRLEDVVLLRSDGILNLTVHGPLDGAFEAHCSCRH